MVISTRTKTKAASGQQIYTKKLNSEEADPVIFFGNWASLLVCKVFSMRHIFTQFFILSSDPASDLDFKASRIGL